MAIDRIYAIYIRYIYYSIPYKLLVTTYIASPQDTDIPSYINKAIFKSESTETT